MIDYIECSIALIKNNTDYLFSRRIKKPFHNHYEFPGGKIENRETPEEALAWECYEEFLQLMIAFVESQKSFQHLLI